MIDQNKSCIVIDPSKDDDGIIRYINKNNLNLKGVLLTHGHFDHFRGLERLLKEFNANFYMGFEEVGFLTSPYLNCSFFVNNQIIFNEKPITVSDKEILKILSEEIYCIHTPFHTIGSYCYYFKNSKLLFSGDFIFKGSVGRSDLPTGNAKLFAQSIQKIINLDENTKIYPGHGGITSIKIEKETNPYLK